MSEPTIVAAYRRILRAASTGRGVRLSWEECLAISADGAVHGVIDTHEEEQVPSVVERATHPTHGGSDAEE